MIIVMPWLFCPLDSRLSGMVSLMTLITFIMILGVKTAQCMVISVGKWKCFTSSLLEAPWVSLHHLI